MDNPNRIRDGINRVFSFGYIELVPEYVSEVAELEAMDDEIHNANKIVHRIIVGGRYFPAFLDPPKEKRMATQFSKGAFETSDIINTMNKAFDLNKPSGMVVCPVFFDWTHPALEANKKRPVGYRGGVDEIAESFYQDIEPFSIATHKGYLPHSIDSGDFNDWKLPTQEAFLADVRVRLIVLPLFKVAFSNAEILKPLGFDDNFIGKRTPTKQYVISNNSRTMVRIYEAKEPPSLTNTLTKEHATVVMGYMTQNVTYFDIVSSAAKDRNKVELVKEINERLYTQGKEVFGFAFSVKINDDGFIDFTVPSTDGVGFKIQMAEHTLKVLGFPPGHSITSIHHVAKEPAITKKVTPALGLSYSSILVLDTGPLTVTMSDTPSITTRGRFNQLMAFMRAEGSVSAMIREMRPVAHFPSKEHTITFKIDRNSDRSEIIGLNWPVGCFVHGVLVGTPI